MQDYIYINREELGGGKGRKSQTALISKSSEDSFR
jgi:hypothetical protein